MADENGERIEQSESTASDFSDYKKTQKRKSHAPKAPTDELTVQIKAAVRQIRSAPGGGRDARAVYNGRWLLVAGEDAGPKEILRNGVDGALTEPDVARDAGRLWWGWWFLKRFVGIEACPEILGDAKSASSNSATHRAIAALARERREWPLDGVVITVRLADFRISAEHARAKGLHLREFINKIYDGLEMRLPVFICVLDLDQIPGYDAFFSQLPDEMARTVIGCRMTAGGAGGPTETLSRYEEIGEQLNRLRLSTLRNGVDRQFRAEVFGFPASFARSTVHFEDFARTFQDDRPNDHQPLLRGFYFTAPCSEYRHTHDLFNRFFSKDARLATRVA